MADYRGRLALAREKADLSAKLLTWYDAHRRDLPWRAKPNELADPYRVWLSEIMLQQTNVTTVKPYFAAFLKRWPHVKALAAAPREDVMQAWAGLGYYARARNLHACAIHVAEKLDGIFPTTRDGLLELPGIGPYTAGAIAKVRADGSLVCRDATGSIHKMGAWAQGAEACNGWTFWHVRQGKDYVLIDELRQQVRSEIGNA